MSNNEFNRKKNICNKVKENTEKHRHSHKGSLYFEGELDYKDSLKNYKIINYKEYEKLIRRKRGIKIVSISLFILLLIIPILDFSLKHFLQKGLLELSGLLIVDLYLKSSSGKDLEGSISSLFSSISVVDHTTIFLISNIFLYCLPIFILAVIFILGMVYYYRKVIKYENIKFRKKSHE
ncbi:fam-l protein [Plasmodium brasilianum]|uniref:Fam-l protein n=1 Tax=Plasmodium brasilianum TaxID=5824 RepID=A0ACB9Y5F6_PLABR|nr:fam-l protein [Plasmodium brasilianum]